MQRDQNWEWGDNEDQLNQTAIAPNQSSRDEDGLNASLQDQRNSAQINKRNETAVKETRKSSKSREDKQSQDARRKEHHRTNDAQNQNHGPPPNMQQPPPNVQHAQQQNAQTHSNAQHRQSQNRPPDFQQSPPLNLSVPPNQQHQAQGNQLWPGGQAAYYEDRSRLFRPSSRPGQNNNAAQKILKNPPPTHSTPNARASQQNNGYGPAISNYDNYNQIPGTSYGQNGPVNTGYAPAPKTVKFADERGDGNGHRNQGQFRQKQ
ncbi:MAG: hypothetical protein GY820_46765, partial [Gammaproteobacteria bacterium]|nr:hypothetical protein [Gammaproteobacteria bacterium]